MRLFHAPARGATICVTAEIKRSEPISIHAPREGGDGISSRAQMSSGQFQSTPPARGATGPLPLPHMLHRISIHAPREGGDVHDGPGGRMGQHFNPRPPRGGRRQELRGLRRMADISIHAPREGGDVGLTRDQIKPALFQSTPPARGATALVGADQIGVLGDFNPRPPRGGRPGGTDAARCGVDFNPRPPRGGRQPMINDQ